MIARVFDACQNKYYISEVYGIVNCGGDLYIVDGFEDDREMLRLVPHTDFSTQPPYQMLIEGISENEPPFSWVYIERENMQEFNARSNGCEDMHYFRGYQFIWAQQECLAQLIREGSILKKDLVPQKITSKLDGWNYIETQEDITALMEFMVGFHDSVMRELHYISGDYTLPDGGICYTEACGKNLQVIFDSEWSGSIELVFEAPRVLHLRFPGENYLAEIYDASVFVKDCKVYFYDSYMNEIPDSYEGTFIQAMGMRWRKI